MDNPIYLLYSTSRQGWFTKASTYTSDITHAQEFDRDEALAMVRKHKTQGAHNMIPVRQEDIQ
jgi:hypothetical protein